MCSVRDFAASEGVADGLLLGVVCGWEGLCGADDGEGGCRAS